MILTECLQFYPDPTSNELNNLQHDLVLIRTFLGKQPVSEKPCPSESVDLATDFRKTLESVLEKPFARVSYNEAIKYVNKEMSTTDFNFKEPYDLSKQDEYKILDWFGGKRPVFITHFPLQLKPFYCQSIDGVNAECSDLLFPGVGELVGASVRETSTTLLRERMKSNNQCTDHSNWYIDLRNTGSVPHAGFGLGFERLLQYILDIANIRDTIAFPRNTYKITL
ncbi:unnamed protein product [Heterobilharzia americana]|nr:unnamed protein product [Heterobilharzia americana]